MIDPLSHDLIRRLEDVDDLPSLPDVLLRVLELCESDSVDIKPLARLVETDAALSAKVIGVVNSLAYGLPNRVNDLEQAIVLLGTEAIKSIVICASLAQVFASPKGAGTIGALEFRRVWRHSLECALLARALARRMSYPNPDEAFLAGLMHDVGKHILLRLFPGDYPQALARARANPDLLLVDEVRLGGLHSEAGAWLVRRWRFADALAEAARCHHEPFHRVLDASLVVRIVYGANFLCSAASGREQFPDERVASLLGVPAPGVAEARAEAARELEETARSLGVDIEGTEEAAELEGRHGQLEREVRSVSMLLASLWGITRAPSEQKVVQTVFRTMCSLFHFDAVLYFSYLAATDTLKCVAASRGPAAESTPGLAVNRTFSKSAVAECSRSASVRYVVSAPATIIDGQIRSALGTSGFVCYPLSARGETIGVLVVGGGNGEGEALRRKEKPLLLLVGEAALSLQADRMRERELDRVRVERIAAAELLADRVVHEVRIPLAAIKNALGSLESVVSGEGPRAVLATASEELDRVERLLGGLDRLAAPPEIDLTELDIGEELRRLQPTLERIPSGGHVSMHIAVAPSLPSVRANADCLRQALVNLVRNAVEAMPEGGAVVVRAERDPAEGARSVRVVVDDTGPGVPERLKGRLFEPLVTTKGAGHRGLGLAIVHSLVRQLGGEVRHEAVEPPSPGSPRVGSRFILSLPALQAGDPSAPASVSR